MGIGWIVKARGLAPSLGAGGTIVVAVLCSLVFVSALLTFRSWPSDDGPAADGASLQVLVPAAKAAGRTASREPAPVTAAAPARRSARRPARSAAARPRAATGAPRATLRAPRTQATPPPAAIQPASPPPASPQSSAPGSPRPSAPASSGGSTGGGAPSNPPGPLESTVATGREVVRDVTAPAPPAVAQPVDDTLDTVQGVARTVDGATDPLIP